MNVRMFPQPYHSKRLVLRVEPWSQGCFPWQMTEGGVLESSTEDHFDKQRTGRIRNPNQLTSCLAEHCLVETYIPYCVAQESLSFYLIFLIGNTVNTALPQMLAGYLLSTNEWTNEWLGRKWFKWMTEPDSESSHLTLKHSSSPF